MCHRFPRLLYGRAGITRPPAAAGRFFRPLEVMARGGVTAHTEGVGPGLRATLRVAPLGGDCPIHHQDDL